MAFVKLFSRLFFWWILLVSWKRIFLCILWVLIVKSCFSELYVTILMRYLLFFILSVRYKALNESIITVFHWSVFHFYCSLLIVNSWSSKFVHPEGPNQSRCHEVPIPQLTYEISLRVSSHLKGSSYMQCLFEICHHLFYLQNFALVFLMI